MPFLLQCVGYRVLAGEGHIVPLVSGGVSALPRILRRKGARIIDETVLLVAVVRVAAPEFQVLYRLDLHIDGVVGRKPRHIVGPHRDERGRRIIGRGDIVLVIGDVVVRLLQKRAQVHRRAGARAADVRKELVLRAVGVGALVPDLHPLEELTVKVDPARVSGLAAVLHDTLGVVVAQRRIVGGLLVASRQGQVVVLIGRSPHYSPDPVGTLPVGKGIRIRIFGRRRSGHSVSVG